MPKNIVICCDGTANEFAASPTHVVKLYSVLTYRIGQQITFYHPGLGTLEPAGALTSLARKVTKLMGMGFGYGLANDIRDAYIFLMKNYEPDDRIFLFGFSRGAYTVRAVCSLLKLYGLIRRDNESVVLHATRLLVGIDRTAGDRAATAQVFDLAEGFRSTLAADCKPWFVGVWDTVSSIGWIENPLKLPHISNNPDIEIGRHAVSMDERRAFFRTNLWRHPIDTTTDYGPKDLKQVRFVGDHCDVGGGHAERESGLSKITLEWMICEAVSAGLQVDQDKVNEVLGRKGAGHVPPDRDGQAHDSLHGWWHLAELVPKKHYDWASGKTIRRPNLWRRRTIPRNSLIHESAFRRADYRTKLPDESIRVGTPCISR
jgi:uncharacterized protein (DUF2235 family)